jgi:hypothetical protein
MLIISVRNLGYTRNAGEFVKRWFSDIGSAGGHRAMAKAVVPLHRFADKFGASETSKMNELIRSLADQFLHDTNGGDKDKKDKDRDRDKKEPLPVPVRERLA